jgi:hypothetical protein
MEVWAALHSSFEAQGKQEWLCYLLVAEGFDWIEFRGAGGGV